MNGAVVKLRRRCPKCRHGLLDYMGIGVAQTKCRWCSYKEPERLTEIFKQARASTRGLEK